MGFPSPRVVFLWIIQVYYFIISLQGFIWLSFFLSLHQRCLLSHDRLIRFYLALSHRLPCFPSLCPIVWLMLSRRAKFPLADMQSCEAPASRSAKRLSSSHGVASTITSQPQRGPAFVTPEDAKLACALHQTPAPVWASHETKWNQIFRVEAE